MAKICEITGKRPRVGNQVSHAKNKTKRWFYPNLQIKKFFLLEEDMWVTLKVSASVIRTINKKGLNIVLKEARERGTLAKELGRLVAGK